MVEHVLYRYNKTTFSPFTTGKPECDAVIRLTEAVKIGQTMLNRGLLETNRESTRLPQWL